MKYLSQLTIATLLAGAVQVADAGNYNKKPTPQPVQGGSGEAEATAIVGDTNIKNYTTVKNHVGGSNSSAEQEQTANGGHGYGGAGGQGGSAEQEQTANATNGGQSNSQSTSYNSTYKGAAAGSAVSAGPVSVPDQCMNGWSVSLSGATFSGSAGVGFTKINPSGVALNNGISLDQYSKSTDNDLRQSATEGFTKADLVKLNCLEKAVDEREDNQKHQIEVITAETAQKMILKGMDHFCNRPKKVREGAALDDEHQAGCRDYSNTAMKHLFGEDTPKIPVKAPKP